MALGPKVALVTGVPLEDVHANVWMGEDGGVRVCEYEPVHASYPGTGDLFASVLTGALTRGDSFEEAVGLATRFVRDVMRRTLECGTEPVYGVQLEKSLGALMRS